MRKTRFVSKLLVVFVLAAVMLTGSAFSTFAAVIQQPTVSPMWDNISTFSLDLAFIGTEGTALGTARKSSSASRIEGTLTVYRQEGSSWIVVDSTSGSKTVGTLRLSLTFAGTPNANYKAVMSITAYANNVGESDSMEDEEICPSN